MYDPKKEGADCDKCPFKGQTVVPPKHAASARLAVLGEAPGFDDTVRGEAFAGRNGAILRGICDTHNVPFSKLHLTHAMLCRKQGATADEYKQAVVCCRPRLARELLSLNLPVVALGKHAVISIIGKSKLFDLLGSPTVGGKFDKKGKASKAKTVAIDLSSLAVMPTLHPSFVRAEPAYSAVLQTHFVRAWQMAMGTLPEWKWPVIHTQDPKKRKAVLRNLIRRKGIVACDVETAGVALFDALLDIGFSDLKEAVSVPWGAGVDAEEAKLVHTLLEKSGCKFVYQNGGFDTVVLGTNGFDFKALLKGYWFDTMIAHHVVAPQLKHKLDFIACVEFPCPRWKQQFRASSEQGSNRYVSADPVERAIYNARDCYVTVRLVKELQERLAMTDKGDVHMARYMALNKIAAEMRLNGFAIIESRFEHHRKELRIRKTMAAKEIDRIARKIGFEGFKPGNNRHTRTMFQNKLGVKTSQFSKKTMQPSYNAKALLEIATDRNDIASKLAQHILVWRRWAKLLGTYVDGMPVYNGKIHATWNPFGTRTGRWASRDPSLQVIPKPKIDKEGNITVPGLRDLFGVRC